MRTRARNSNGSTVLAPVVLGDPEGVMHVESRVGPLEHVIIFGLLSMIGLPKCIDMRRTACAARVASEFVAIRLATYTCESDHHNQWPADQGPGMVLPELLPCLHGVLFKRLVTSNRAEWPHDNFVTAADFINQGIGDPHFQRFVTSFAQ